MGHWMPVLSGVPQGSVLGKLFFIIYNNNLITSIQIPIKVFADTKLIFPYNNHIQCVALQNALDIISDWTSIWLLHLNIEKCKVHMGPKRFLLNKTVYFINGVALQNSLVEKDLGILVR